MDVAITGSSGLIGTALSHSLVADGHRVVRLVRTDASGDLEVAWDPDRGTIDSAQLEGIDAVVHLAGAGIASGRWTEAQKRRVHDSRSRGTALLAESLVMLDRRPSVLVSGSAVGYYGDRGDEDLTEASAPGHDFLAGVCKDWEAATGMAAAAGIRVACIRSGVVLSTEDGILTRLLLPFKLGLGGRFGDGRGYLSWITIDDEVAAIRFLLDHDVAGAVNLTAPAPVTTATFAKTLGAALHRPAVVPVPHLVTKLPFGIGPLADSLIFTSAKVHPTVLQDAGFTFTHPDLESALRALLGHRHEQAAS